MGSYGSAAAVRGCLECGSEHGSQFQLCPACINRKRQERVAYRKRFQEEYMTQEHGTVSLDSPVMMGAGIVLLGFLVFSGYILFSPLEHEGLIAMLYLAVSAAAYSISLLSWGYFWMRMIILDFMWAVASCILPCLVYRYIALNPEQAMPIAAVHFTFLGLSFVFTWLLADHLGISICAASTIFITGTYEVQPLVGDYPY